MVGTRCAPPSSLPFSSGNTKTNSFCCTCAVRNNILCSCSCTTQITFWVGCIQGILIISISMNGGHQTVTIPNCIVQHFAIGARQFVVQEAQEIIVSLPSRISWFTLKTTVFKSPVAGAEITTLLAPAFKCASAFALSVKKPVLSITTSTPWSPQGICEGSFCAYIFTSSPFTMMEFSVLFTSWSKRPWPNRI
jgi:antitoxin component of MazEF toxin-antitoxin module